MKILYEKIPECVECPFYKEEDSMSSGDMMPTYIHKCTMLRDGYTWTSIGSRNRANELIFQDICKLPDENII